MHVKVKKPPELGHIELLYCLSSQEYISKTLDVTHYFHWQLWQVAGDLELLAQLVNTRSHLSECMYTSKLGQVIVLCLEL